MAEISRRRSTLSGTIKDQASDNYRMILGEYLLKAGQITRGHLEEATKWLRGHPKDTMSRFMLRKGYVEGNTIPSVLSRQYSYPMVNLNEREIPANVLGLVPYEVASRHMVIPYQSKDNKLLMAMVEPTNNKVVEELANLTKLQVVPAVITERDLLTAYRQHYRIDDAEEKRLTAPLDPSTVTEDAGPVTVDNLGALISDALDDFSFGESKDDDAPNDTYSAENSAIINLANQILVQAVQLGVSDVHIEPFEKQFYVRYRADGSLYKHTRLPLEIRNALIARLKIMASLDITERRVPQDGRIKMRLGKNKEIDFRVSSLPTLFGESVVLRILDKSGLNVDMTKLGFTQKNLDQFMRAAYRPNGLLLVTGPTGSGKTVTLYSTLSLRNTDDVKILTAEDPVEFNFPGVNQVNVIKEVGMTFARALKAFLRQDPDICMIGEIRDLETGEIAVEAAMTGHLVLSTLHTNDAPSTVTRLVDMGVAPFNVAAALVVCSAQRLLRRVCPNCKQPMGKLPVNKLMEAGFDSREAPTIQLYEGRGCPTCKGTGYKGRLGVFEVMENSPTISDAIASKVPEGHLRKIALKQGMYTLRQDGLLKCQQGMTTLEQVLEKTVIQKESLPHYLLNPDEMIFENGDTIIKEGNTDSSFYKLIQGCLEVFKGQNLIAEISQGNTYFGEMSAMVGSRRSATIRSKGRSIVKVFPGDKLPEVLENYPDISKQIIDTLVLRLNESSNRLSEMMQNRVELERTYVNQLTATVGSAASMPNSGRPIAAVGRSAAGGPPPTVATASKPSALAKLAARKAAASGGGNGAAAAAPAGGNGSGGQPIIRPVAKGDPAFAQTALASSGPGQAQIKPVAAAPPQRPVPIPAQAVVPVRPAPSQEPEIEVTPVVVEASAVQAGGPPARSLQPPRTAPDLTVRRSGFARNLLPADQTQLVVVRESGGPAARILREVRQSARRGRPAAGALRLRRRAARGIIQAAGPAKGGGLDFFSAIFPPSAARRPRGARLAPGRGGRLRPAGSEVDHAPPRRPAGGPPLSGPVRPGPVGPDLVRPDLVRPGLGRHSGAPPPGPPGRGGPPGLRQLSGLAHHPLPGPGIRPLPGGPDDQPLHRVPPRVRPHPQRSQPPDQNPLPGEERARSRELPRGGPEGGPDRHRGHRRQPGRPHPVDGLEPPRRGGRGGPSRRGPDALLHPQPPHLPFPQVRPDHGRQHSRRPGRGRPGLGRRLPGAPGRLRGRDGRPRGADQGLPGNPPGLPGGHQPRLHGLPGPGSGPGGGGRPEPLGHRDPAVGGPPAQTRQPGEGREGRGHPPRSRGRPRPGPDPGRRDRGGGGGDRHGHLGPGQPAPRLLPAGHKRGSGPFVPDASPQRRGAPKPGHRGPARRRALRPRPVTSVVLDRVGVTLGQFRVLADVSLALPGGRQTVVIGPNGAGKSTLVQTILGQWPHEGSIVFDPPAPRFGYVPQRLDFDRHMPLTVVEFLALGLTRRPLWLGLGRRTAARAAEGLEMTRAGRLARQPMGALSGGETQRVLLAAALLAEPDILVLDEPATGVDINGEQLLCELLDGFKSRFTIIMVSHDLPTARAHGDWMVCLNRRVVAQGPPEEVFRPSVLAATFGLHQGLEPHPAACGDCPSDRVRPGGGADAAAGLRRPPGPPGPSGSGGGAETSGPSGPSGPSEPSEHSHNCGHRHPADRAAASGGGNR
jgi:type IV pilus assembly protein PilB